MNKTLKIIIGVFLVLHGIYSMYCIEDLKRNHKQE